MGRTQSFVVFFDAPEESPFFGQELMATGDVRLVRPAWGGIRYCPDGSGYAPEPAEYEVDDRTIEVVYQEGCGTEREANCKLCINEAADRLLEQAEENWNA